MKKTKQKVAAKSQTSQEFFPRSKSSGGDKSGSGGFIFNKAPVNKNQAKQAAKNKVMAEQEVTERRAQSSRAYEGQKKGQGFLSKLYQDDDELDNLRVLGAIDDDDEEVKAARNSMIQPTMNKRMAKASEKLGGAIQLKKDIVASKIGRLHLRKGALGMFAVCEVATDHLIVNHTRNTKGFISLKDTPMSGKGDQFFRVGHFVIAAVVSEIGTSQSGQVYDFKHGSGINRKVQMTILPSALNKQLNAHNLVRGMVLQGIVESKEAKGYVVNLGLKDGSKGFLKSSDSADSTDPEKSKKKDLKTGRIIQIVVKNVIESSKIVKCEQLKPGTHSNQEDCVVPASAEKAPVTIGHLKPGFLVNAKIQQVFHNGVELSFLKGITGTCFADHASDEIAQGDLQAYSVGQKVVARVIQTDPIHKTVTLSMNKGILEWSPRLSSSKTSGTASSLHHIKIGQLMKEAKVIKVLYGSSYLVKAKLDDGTLQLAFLHKSHTRQSSKEEAEAASEQQQETELNAEMEQFEEGQVIPEVRVKEINWFDGLPVVTIRQGLLGTDCLNYHQMSVGQYVKAKVARVDTINKCVVFKINEFIQGKLNIEHMGDGPLKQIPPKYQQVGKEINLRVLNVDASARLIEFTKKDSLMKEDCPVYKNHKEIQKGSKIVGVVVSTTEYGHVVRTFGPVKGLLSFEDIKKRIEDKSDKKGKDGDEGAKFDYKVGSVIKAYCLFKKAGKGVALTLSKKTAKAGADEATSPGSSRAMEALLPTESQVDSIIADDTFTTMIKASVKQELVGQVHSFRVVRQVEEDQRSFSILKSTDAEKKSKNFIAILPQCLAPKGSGLQQIQEIKGVVLQMVGGESQKQQLPLVSVQQELVSLKDSIYNSTDHGDLLVPGNTFVGVVNGASSQSGQVSIRFMNGVLKTIKAKDLNSTSNIQGTYQPGKPIRVAVNKLGRLCTKQSVIDSCLAAKKPDKDSKTDKEIQLQAFLHRPSSSSATALKIGSTVETAIQLVKDYGIIGQFGVREEEGGAEEMVTGFVVNEQRKVQEKGKYKVGQKMRCCVLDYDPVKKIADLSEKLVVGGADSEKQGSKKEQNVKEGRKCQAIIELNKESYVIASVRGSKQAHSIGVCLLHNFNNDDASNPYQSYQVGESIPVKVLGLDESTGFLKLLPDFKKQDLDKKNNGSSGLSGTKLEEGVKLQGEVKSIKNQQAFIQTRDEKGTFALGRLLLSECEKSSDFESLKKGTIVEVKVLKITKVTTSKGSSATLLELTKKQQHMDNENGLDEDLKVKSLLTVSDLKVGQTFPSSIILGPQKESALNLNNSKPLQVQVSINIRGQIPFNHIVSAAELAKFGTGIVAGKKEVQGGARVEVRYLGDSNFSLLAAKDVKAASQFKKSDLVTARFVRVVKGKGVTVQLEESTYGFVEMCEITDSLAGNVFKMLQDKKVFAARIIDVDNSGKWQLSTRESVVDPESWSKAICPSAPSKDFMSLDQQRQDAGNLRNKILKYGAGVAVAKGDLAVGYVTNIGKPGCFIQIGHKCTVRAGLNELSDVPNYKFEEDMLVGRLVLGRITKVDSKPNGEKRFDFSTRQSLVVYGVGAIDRSKLTVGTEVTSIVMAVADSKAFCQVKGTYIKIKVKQFGSQVLRPGDHVVSTIKKLTSAKISSNFLGMAASTGSSDLTEGERLAESVYSNIAKVFKQESKSLKQLLVDSDKNKKEGDDFNQKDVAMSDGSDALEQQQEEIERQINDLHTLEKVDKKRLASDNSDGDEDEDEPMDGDDSDEQEIQRIIKMDEDSDGEEEGENEMDEDMEEDVEGQTDEEMSQGAGGESDSDEDSDSDSEELGKKKKESKLKKRTLKQRVLEEQEIREKEKRMRTDTDKPQDIDDFERLLVSNQDESYVWIQYMAFMLDNVGLDAARKIAERAVSSISMTSEQNKLNLWTAYMNLESNFGKQEELEAVTKRALEVNDRRKVYMNLIDIYRSSMKFGYIEIIYRQLTKKFGKSLEIWSGYLEFLLEMRQREKEGHNDHKDFEFGDPKTVLQRSLQALPKDQHVNIISKMGMLEFKFGAPETGRTMFEGIVSSYPKRMDIWSIYMDMELKYGQGNVTQARHLFERCLSNEHIRKKPKKMKLVFQKYMDFENKQGNKTKLQALRDRVEEYLSHIYGDQDSDEQEEEATATATAKQEKKSKTTKKQKEEVAEKESSEEEEEDSGSEEQASGEQDPTDSDDDASNDEDPSGSDESD